MMTSVGSERTRGTRDKMQISTSQPTQPQKQVVQATAEQIRLAQMIYDKNDTDFEDKVKQLMEVTGKNQDECIVALHDCNGDVNRAINILLEGSSDTTSWETVGGKKKSLGKEGLENKENREKRGDREMIRGWGSSNRWGRGGSRGREFRAEENGVDSNQGDRPSDRGKRGCGRGFGRGRGRGAGRFSAQSMGTFNPADYMESSATGGFGTKSEIWETGQNDADDGTGAWKNSVEEWTAEDWNEDLSETKVFTASSVPAENHVTPKQSIDLVTLLQKPEKPMTLTQETEGNSFEAPQQQTFGQALVFTNSQHSTQVATGTGSSSSVNSYSPPSLSAVLCSGFGEHGSPKLTNSTGSLILDQLKSPGLGQFTSQQNNNSSTTTTTSSWDRKLPITQASVLSQFATSSVPALKTEPSPSLPSAGSLPSMVSTTASLLPSASQHAGTFPSLPQSSDLASSSLSQLSSSLSNHQSSLSPASVLSSSTSHVHTSVENTTSLQPSTTFSTASTSATSTTSSVVSMASSMNTTASLSLSVTSVSATTRAAPLMSSGKAPPNLPQGVPPLLHNQYIVGPGGLLPAYPQIYGYDDLQMLQSRLPMKTEHVKTFRLHPHCDYGPGLNLDLWPLMVCCSSRQSRWNMTAQSCGLGGDYYGITFPAPATLTGRDGSLANNPYSGDIKFGRGDSASPAPATTLTQSQQNQTQTHHTTQQPFLNPTLPPGYSYTGLPYYAGVPGVPSAFQYGPTMFVPPASAKQHGVNLNTSTPFQQGSGYGQHGYGTGYDDLTQGTAAGDYSKGGYSGSSQAQNKSAGTGPGKGVSVTSSNTGVPDISGSVYNKTQTFDKQGFHAGTPPSFSLPSAIGSTGLNPGAAPGYAPAPFLHILPAHQQPHSQMLHHHLQQDGQGGSGQRNQPSTMQQKSQATKTYGTSPYWTN
ncbi:ubiquitin-associated protein 2-like isoform X9 [Poecile atricapillus]|uniref:ubiquitin-associated protein 2-like isoform X9 n=1 Tax=Poecile atricapillus TaxID=48891 RepID=UPI0027393A7D|nr:ubiquitin-associated protein 2-like isoform X9 [Poecile atricapillus]